MIAFVYITSLFVILPAVVGWAARKLIRNRNPNVSLLIITCAAAAPSLWMFYATQQADGITRAASLYVVPFLFLFSLVPAAIGMALADRPKRPQ